MMIGQLVNNAAVCDVILFSAFKIISECSLDMERAIYYTVESFHAKKKLISRTLNVSNFKSSEKIIARIISATQKAHNQRNEISHALLRYNDKEEVLCQNPRQQVHSRKQISASYLGSLLKHSSAAFFECQIAAHELSMVTGEPCPLDL